MLRYLKFASLGSKHGNIWDLWKWITTTNILKKELPKITQGEKHEAES